MATVAALKVILTAKTAAFAQGMGRASSIVGRFGSSVARIASPLKMLSGSLIGIAGIGGLGYVGARSARTIDALGKTADKLGATTEGLATLRHIAKLSGVEANTFDMSLQRLTRRAGSVAAGEAAMGKSARLAARFFKALNLDAKALAAMPADEAFLEWAKALGKIDDQSKRVALAFKFVDSEGVGVVNMIDALTKEYADYVRLAESLGIRLTRVQVKLVEKMNDALLNLRTKVGAIVDQTVVRLAPVFEAVFKKLTDAIGHPAKIADWLVGKLADLGRSILRFVDWITPAVLRGIKLVAGAFEDVLGIVGKVQDLPGFGGRTAGIVEAIEALQRIQVKMTEGLAELQGKTIYDRVVGLFSDAISAAKTAAAIAVGARPPFDRMELEDIAEAAGRSAKYSVRLASPSEFGGFVGGQPAARRFWSGSIELKVQREQLAELKGIRTAVEILAAGEGDELGG